jgi:hypothetical protein
LGHLFEQVVIAVPVYVFVDFSEQRDQLAEFFLQAGEVAVYRMQLLPELSLQPKDVILAGWFSIEESSGDLSFRLPVGKGRADELAFDLAIHCFPSL